MAAPNVAGRQYLQQEWSSGLNTVACKSHKFSNRAKHINWTPLHHNHCSETGGNPGGWHKIKTN
jgi:hypothetical protein